MDSELLRKLKDLSAKEGPFMSHEVDSEVVPSLLEWVGSDWERLRILLNYMHERGAQVALRQVRDKSITLLASVDRRVFSTWEPRLHNPDWHK